MREKFLQAFNRAVTPATQTSIKNMMGVAIVVEYAAPLFNTLQKIALTRPQPKDKSKHFFFWHNFGDPHFHYLGMNYHNLYISFGWITGNGRLEFGPKEKDKPAPLVNYTRIGQYRIGYHVDPNDLHIAESDPYRGTEYYLRSGEEHFRKRGIHSISDPVDFACQEIQRKVAEKTYSVDPVLYE